MSCFQHDKVGNLKSQYFQFDNNLLRCKSPKSTAKFCRLAFRRFRFNRRFRRSSGSGSSREEIREAIEYGAVKMNIDTDMQWAFWDGIRGFYEKKKDYLQGQIGNPDGADKPNKKHYDPRNWLREGEKALISRLKTAFEDLDCIGRNE